MKNIKKFLTNSLLALSFITTNSSYIKSPILNSKPNNNNIEYCITEYKNDIDCKHPITGKLSYFKIYFLHIKIKNYLQGTNSNIERISYHIEKTRDNLIPIYSHDRKIILSSRANLFELNNSNANLPIFFKDNITIPIYNNIFDYSIPRLITDSTARFMKVKVNYYDQNKNLKTDYIKLTFEDKNTTIKNLISKSWRKKSIDNFTWPVDEKVKLYTIDKKRFFSKKIILARGDYRGDSANPRYSDRSFNTGYIYLYNIKKLYLDVDITNKSKITFFKQNQINELKLYNQLLGLHIKVELHRVSNYELIASSDTYINDFKPRQRKKITIDLSKFLNTVDCSDLTLDQESYDNCKFRFDIFTYYGENPYISNSHTFFVRMK